MQTVAQHVMAVNGLVTEVNMPPALRQTFDGAGNEIPQALPPYGKQPVYNVDDFPQCPDSWMRGSANEASFCVGVKPEHGLWLDFNQNAGHTHQVAVVVSIQGINAVTGQKTEGLRLEQYREMCPVHNTRFGSERFCESCGYKWPHQNYLATTGTPAGLLWLDGFRGQDGVVRQWVFTEEEMRGIAAQVIGKDRVFAIGIAFYLSKQPKPPPAPPRHAVRRAATVAACFPPGVLVPQKLTLGHMPAAEAGAVGSAGALEDLEETEGLEFAAASVHPCFVGVCEVAGALHVGPFANNVAAETAADQEVVTQKVRPVKHFEIAGGARIEQEVYPDPQSLEFWADKPAGVIYVNYTDEETLRTILAAGTRDRTARGEGFMARLNVGHPPAPKG